MNTSSRTVPSMLTRQYFYATEAEANTWHDRIKRCQEAEGWVMRVSPKLLQFDAVRAAWRRQDGSARMAA